MLQFECNGSILFPEKYAKVVATLYGPISGSGYEAAMMSINSCYTRKRVTEILCGNVQLMTEDNLKACISDLKSDYEKNDLLKHFRCECCMITPRCDLYEDGSLHKCHNNWKDDKQKPNFVCDVINVDGQVRRSDCRKVISVDELFDSKSPFDKYTKDELKLAVLERLQSLIYIDSETNFEKYFKDPILLNKAKSLFDLATSSFEKEKVSRRVNEYNEKCGYKDEDENEDSNIDNKEMLGALATSYISKCSQNKKSS